MDDVYQDSIVRLMQLAKDTFKDEFKAYYEGDPIVIPDANFPCLIIDMPASNFSVKNAPTGHDNVGEKVRIKLVLNKQDDFGAEDDFDLTERRLRRYVQARDATTGQLKEGTLMKALRTNLTLGSSVIDADMDVNYDLQPRPEKQITSEAVITIVIRELIEVSNRL